MDGPFRSDDEQPSGMSSTEFITLKTPPKEHGKIGMVSLLNALPMAALVTDSSQLVLGCNESASRWFDQRPTQILGMPLWDFLKENDEGESHFFRSGESAPAVRGEIPDSLGAALWLMREHCVDRPSRLEAARHLAERLEAERLRLARDLHDGALQELIGIGFCLAALKRNLDTDSVDRNRKAVTKIRDDSLSVARLLRAVVSKLRPPGLQEFGLAQALDGLAAKLSRDFPDTCPAFELKLEELPNLSINSQICLFRCAQEALNNCLRHARARRVSLILKSEGPRVTLKVEDDGIGFIVPAQLHHFIRSAHYGLAGMAERVALVSGTMTVRSFAKNKKGTLISLSIPSL
jgi:signal transduction histidine kinase